MILKSFYFPFGPLEVNLFLMGDEASGQAILVDAGVYDESVIAFAREAGLSVESIILTHHHDDHVAALADYVTAWDAKVLSPAPLKSAPDARIVKPGDKVRVASFEFEIFKTAGHTPESITYYCAEQNLCFVGDALFAGAVGGTSADELHAEEVGCIREHLLGLAPETRIYSGHGPATTIEIEKAANPFLQPGFTRQP